MTLRQISWTLEINWGAPSGWDDESTNLISASGSMRAAAPGSSIAAPRGIVDDMTLVLHNAGGRYSPFNDQSPLYPYISENKSYQRPVRLSVSIGGLEYRVFTGTIKIPQETSPSIRSGATVSIDCRGYEDMILTKKLITSHFDFINNRSAGLNESELMAYVLNRSGMIDGTHYISQELNPATATLDPGIFIIPYFWLDDESPIEDCWTLAAAAGGRFFAGPDGLFYYENAYHPVLDRTSVRTYDRSVFADHRPVYDDTELYSGASVEAAPRSVLTPGVMWEPDEPIRVGAGETQTLTAKLRQPYYEVIEIQYDAITAGGLDINSSVTVTPSYYAQRIDFSIANNHAEQAAYLRNFNVIGSAISGATTHEELRESNDTFWGSRSTRIRSVRSNPYVQSRRQAGFLAEMLKDAHAKARPIYHLERTAGDPELRIGDRVTVDDSKLNINRTAWITGINWSLSATAGFRQNITAIDDGDYFPYMDTPGYFQIDVDNTNGFKRVFY